MHDSRITAALARGAVVVTPNKRLARDVVDRHDALQRAKGLAAWPSARALPWTTFVGELLQLALDSGLPVPALRLDASQCAHLWRGAVQRALRDAPLVDADATAVLATEAWERLHAWGDGRDARIPTDGSDDAALFVRAAETFRNATARRGALDAARMADALVPFAVDLRALGLREVVGTGFIEWSPQQRRLLTALADAGVAVDLGAVGEREPAGNVAVARASSPDAEIAGALGWARDKVRADPQAIVGIVVLDLAQRKERVAALATDLLCPSRLWPGGEDRSPPFDISAGDPLARTPVVATAIDLVALGHGPIPVHDAISLVRSPYLPAGRERWPRRAALERALLERGAPSVAAGELVARLQTVDPDLAARWRQATQANRPKSRSPRDWVEHWKARLEAFGWCEDGALSAAERAARGAWQELLLDFAHLGAVAPTLSPKHAMQALRRAAEDRPFQPEAPGARIRILGMLEAAGLAFDALWVAGLTADAWPQAPDPNPLLPLAWQRAHGVPRSSPERELDFARRLTAQLAVAARDVVFSYPCHVDDRPATASPLLARLPTIDLPSPPPTPARVAFDRPARLAAIADATLPALPEGTFVWGGAGAIDTQSTCPFRAAMRYRLDARDWPALPGALDSTERGTLLHATLEAFWRAVRDQRTLRGLDDDALDRALAQAFARARSELPDERWRAVPVVVAAGEEARVVGTVRQWLRQVESGREPFEVVALESDTRREVTLRGLRFDVRFDRLDRNEDGTSTIVDYKSGVAPAPRQWFEARPSGVQLALYAHAHAQQDAAHRVAALVFGQLKVGETAAVGLPPRPDRWEGLRTPADVGESGGDWPGATMRLQRALDRLADEIRAGHAAVAPRDDKACAYCHLHALCRVQSLGDEEDAARLPEDADG